MYTCKGVMRGTKAELADYVTACETCTKNQIVKHQPRAEVSLPRGPWQEVGTDLFEFEGGTYLVVIDYYSRWIETAVLVAQTS